MMARKIVLLYGLILGCSHWLTAQTFTASPNSACMEGSTLTFQQTVIGLTPSSTSAFGFYEVCITLNHNRASDLRLYLEAPDGTYRTLIQNNGGNGSFGAACFRLFADSSIRYCTAPFASTYMAYADLLDFTNGSNPNGLWKLHYLDNVTNGITGTLVNWSLTFQSNPNQTALLNSKSNLPIFNITTIIGSIPDDPKTDGVLNIVNNSNGINPFNTTVFNQSYKIAIETQGFTSAWNAKPNYDFEVRTFDYTNDSSIALLNLPKESDWILKACVTDDYMMKDPVTFEMSRKMGYYAPRTRYCELIVNNTYVGLYILTEKVKRDSNRVDIAKLTSADTAGTNLTGGYIFEINPNGDPAAWYSNYLGYQFQNLTQPYEFKLVYPRQNSIHPNQLNYIHSFVDSFENALQSTNYQDPENGWRKYASENDLINFLIVSEYSTNYDTYGRSTYLFKEKVTDGNKIHCGPPWDADRGYCCDTGWVHIITHGYWVFPFWWQKLRTDSVFNKRLACRFSNLRKDELSDTSFLNYIDVTEGRIRHAKQRNTNKWQNYLADIQLLKNNIVSRLAWMQGQLSNTVYPPQPLTNTTFCLGDPINIYINNQYTYNFKPGPDTSYFIPTQPGTYKAVVASNYGCETIQNLTVLPPITPVITGNATPCAQSIETYSINPIAGTSMVWTIYGGTPIAGCGSGDATCTVQWGNPNFCMVKVKRSFSTTCSDTDIHPITLKICTSTQDIDRNMLAVYPSPAQRELRIESEHIFTRFEMLDMMGAKVKSGNFKPILSVADLTPAHYILKLTDERNQVFMAQFTKE